MDRNETACGACRRIGELICCEGCVAAFHARCAGYDSQSEVPAGDWHCWFCARNKGFKYQHPNTVFKAPRTQQTHVMLAIDDQHLDRFYRCQVQAISEGYVELKSIDVERDTEIVQRSSNRLWHGSVDKNTWSIEGDGVTWRPNSRLFELELGSDALNSSKASASARQQRPARDSRPQAAARPAVDGKSRGLPAEHVPEGEVGAGLPIIRGGAGQDEFDAALNSLWKRLLGSGYPERMPQCLLMPGHSIEPWYLWREVWSWGGPDVITDNKLWATVGFSFNAPYTSSAATSRIKKSYDLLIAPLDQAVSAGDVQLEHPAKCRLPKHRALQIRPPLVPGTSPAAPAAVRHAVSCGGSGSGGRRRDRPRKRSQKEAWSSSDDEAAPDFGSDYEDPDVSESSGVVSGSRSGDEGGQEEPSSQEEEEEEIDELQEESSSEAAEAMLGETATGLPPPKRVRTVVTPRAVVTSGGGRSRAQQTADSEVLGRISLSAVAQKIKVGSVVDFRLISPEGTCATGWRSGTVLASEPGSAWEGGRWLLIQPRHHQHAKPQQQHDLKPLPDSPAAAALAAVTAAGCEGPIADAAQKLLTPGGHLRQELAGLIQPRVRLGPPMGQVNTPAAAAGAAADQQQQVPQARDATAPAAAAAAAADTFRPVWVPVVWRGSYSSPFPRPVVMVRPHYAGASTATTGGLVSSGSSQLLRASQPGLATADVLALDTSRQLQQQVSMDRQQSLASIYTGLLAQHQVAVGTSVEVLRQGSWWPATVIAAEAPGQQLDGLDVSPPTITAAAASSLSDGRSFSQVSVAGPGGVAVDGGCVVLRNDDAPNADGAVWRCSRAHPMRPAHPQHSLHFGMLLLKRENVMSLAALRKQLQPYIYAGNIQAFSCLHHMRPDLGQA